MLWYTAVLFLRIYAIEHRRPRIARRVYAVRPGSLSVIGSSRMAGSSGNSRGGGYKMGGDYEKRVNQQRRGKDGLKYLGEPCLFNGANSSVCSASWYYLLDPQWPVGHGVNRINVAYICNDAEEKIGRVGGHQEDNHPGLALQSSAWTRSTFSTSTRRVRVCPGMSLP